MKKKKKKNDTHKERMGGGAGKANKGMCIGEEGPIIKKDHDNAFLNFGLLFYKPVLSFSGITARRLNGFLFS